jgi:hypothetical protein
MFLTNRLIMEKQGTGSRVQGTGKNKVSGFSHHISALPIFLAS